MKKQNGFAIRKLEGALLAAFFIIVAPVFASAQTIDQLQARIQALLQQVAILQAQQSASSTRPDDYGTGVTVDDSCPNLTRTMQRGARDIATDQQVSALQTFFAEYYDLKEEGLVTGYFGKLTHAYVIKFQKENSLPALGIVGQLTREKIASECVSNSTEDSEGKDTSVTTTQTTSTQKDSEKEKAPRCRIWTTPETVLEKVSYTVSWNITGGKGTLTYPSGESVNVGTKDDSVREKGRTVGTYRYGMKVENGARSTSCSTSIKVTVSPPTTPTTTPPTVQYETYRAYVDGELIAEVKDSRREVAYEACLKVADKYSDDAIRCTWGTEEIYTREAPTTNERSIDLKVNGSNGPIALQDEEEIKVTWKSSGYKQCGIYAVWPAIGDQYANVPDLGLSGSRTMYAYAPYYPVTIRLRCQTTAPSGSPIIEDDTVQVIKPS